MIKTKAIVINQRSFNDHDALVSFYSLEFGKISLLARGLRRPNSKLAGHLDSFNLVDLMIIRGRERDYIGSAISENSFLDIKSDYNKIKIAGQGLRFLSSLNFNNQSDFETFLLIRDFLKTVNDFSLDKNLFDKTANFSETFFLEVFLLIFKTKLLSLMGYDFDFSYCFSCGKKEAVALNFFKKETYCSDCLKNIRADDFKNNFIRISQKTINLKRGITESSLFTFNHLNINKSSKKELELLLDIVNKII